MVRAVPRAHQRTGERHAAWCAVALAVVTLGVGCMAESHVEAPEATRRASVWPADAGNSGRPVADAGRFASAYFAAVAASGTGCPERSWDAKIKPNGETFELTFSDFELAVGSGPSVMTKDCLLSIKLHGARALSYAILDTYYTGYATLDEGVTVRHAVQTYVQGNPRDAKVRRATFTGPLEDAYSFKGESKVADIVWSDCARDVDLNIRIELRLERDQGKGKGEVQLQKLSAFRLATRECG